MRAARVQDGVVAEIVELPESVKLVDAFPAALGFRECGPEVEIGWIDDKGKLNPPPPRSFTRDDLLAYASEKRWRVETGGIDVAGLPVHTDDRSKMMIGFARMKATSDPDFTTQWKGVDGVFVTLDAPTIIALSDAVLWHVDACFRAEERVTIDIQAGTITGFQDIDAADWP